MARAATSPELTLLRTFEPHGAKLYAAIYTPATIYTARVNQTFATYDDLLEITYDTGSGTLADVLPDMTIFVGSSAGAWDKGICRVRGIDATKVYISQSSDIAFADNQYLTIVDDYSLWAKHLLIDNTGAVFMDGGTAYSDQHAAFDPTPIMGPNRVLKLTGTTVSTTFNGASSYIIDGSSIASKAWSAPGASATSGMTGNTPTITYNAAGWYCVYLTVTGANGKSFTGVRYVYVWSDANPPTPASIGDNGCDVEAGGWEFRIALHSDASLTQVRDHALVILFADDYYGATNQSIGPVTGCENILFSGWIAKESISMSPDAKIVEFTAYTGHYFMQQIPSYPNGIEIVNRAAAVWTEMQNLTTDKGVWHFLHWRTTTTRVMDVTLSGDTKYSREVSSLAGNLWSQLQEMAFDSIFARPGVDRYNRFYLQVHPNLIPEASRSTIPTVMTITKADRVAELEFERVTIPEVSVVAASGVAVTAAGVGSPYFSLAPGHTLPRYGATESIENLLVSDQTQCNTLTGLYQSWRNNVLPEIPISFIANNRLIDCFPNQYCSISISSGDNVRGYAYSGKLVPLAVSYVYDPETGYLHTEASFEAETFEGIAVNGDVPGSGDRSTPPAPSYPALPDFPVIIPGVPGATANGPTKVLFYDPVGGLIYTENFHEASPTYYQVNGGLGGTNPDTGNPYYQDIERFFVTPSGAVYAFRMGRETTSGYPNTGRFFLARAPSIGGTFSFIVQSTDFGDPGADTNAIVCGGYNPLANDTVMFIMADGRAADNNQVYMGSGGTLSAGAVGVPGTGGGQNVETSVSYGLNKWLYVSNGTTYNKVISVDGSSVTATGVSVANALPVFNPETEAGIRAATTGRVFTTDGTDLFITENNMGSSSTIALAGFTMVGFACDPSGSLLMSRYNGGKSKSSDGGSSWSVISGLPVGSWYFAYGGPGDDLGSSRWIAAGAVIRYSDDFGATWDEKTTTSLTDITPFPAIKRLQVIEF